jgi:anti-sigma factor ChrR (cupin superfamily)
MIPDDLEALVLADAIGALDADEQRELQARLAELTPDAHAHVARLYETPLLLASVVEPVEPPPGVRERVMQAARTPANYTVPGGDAAWFDSGLAGITAKVLAVDRERGLVTLLLRARAGAVYPAHQHSGPEECYVVRGSITIDGHRLRAGDFHHADEGSEHSAITTDEGAEVLVVGAIADYLPGH